MMKTHNDTIDYPAKQDAENSRQYVYRVLKDAIMFWDLMPGEVLNDQCISSRLGVSRTPVREALFSLKEDHLVTVYARNKTVVSLVDWRLINEGKFVRTSLETLVADSLCGCLPPKTVGALYENLALQRNLVEGGYGNHTFYELDNDFHRILFDAAGKSETYRMVRRMCYQVDRVRYYMIPRANMIPSMLESHRSILNCIIDSDREKLAAILEKHINDMFDDKGQPAAFAVKLLSLHPEYFCNVPKDIQEKAFFSKAKESKETIDV